MSGKRARQLRRQKKLDFSKKRIVSAVIGASFVAMPVAANGDVLLSFYPHFTMPVGKNTHSIQYGLGGGTRVVYKPLDFLQFGVFGDYYNFPIQDLKAISLFDAGLTAGYILPLGDRFSMNFNLDAGIYRAIRDEAINGINAGVNVSFSYKARPSVSVGGGASFNHYAAGRTALINGATVSPEVTFNITDAFGKKSNLKMDTKEVRPVFPVLYSWYDNNRFATITVKNEDKYAIENVKVSFYQPQYMGQPKVCYTSGAKKKLAVGESVEIDLTAFFNERMLEMTEKTDQQAIVTVEYTCLGQKRTQDFLMVIPVYGRNSMSWADDRRAAVFVSSKDPAAMLYSKYVSSVVRENMRIGIPENIQFAVGIFNSLSDFGINYVIDPSSAYADNVGTETPDFLQFPYQTLSYRGGDCDDLSILMCSLLEAIGIDTAFITVPGHIYMAFNSGLNVKMAQEQFGTLDNFIVRDDEVWVPLEITLTNEGFDKAWRTGAREWRVAARNNEASFYKMKDSWQIYKPVSVPSAEVTFSMLEKDQIAMSFTDGIDTLILREIEQKINSYKTYIARTGDIKARNALGALYGRYGLFKQAKEQLSYPATAGYIPAMINTANVYFAEKDYATAERMYKNIIRRDRGNALAYLGVARCCYEQDNFDECDLAYNRARELDEDLASSYTYLGVFESTTGRAFNLADRLSYTIWQSDELELSNIILDNSVAELEDLYGKAATALIEKTKSNAPHLPRLDFLTTNPIRCDEFELDSVLGLPNQISILPPDEILASLNQIGPKQEALPPEDKLALLQSNKQDALPVFEKEKIEAEETLEDDGIGFEDTPKIVEIPVVAEIQPPVILPNTDIVVEDLSDYFAVSETPAGLDKQAPVIVPNSEIEVEDLSDYYAVSEIPASLETQAPVIVPNSEVVVEDFSDYYEIPASLDSKSPVIVPNSEIEVEDLLDLGEEEDIAVMFGFQSPSLDDTEDEYESAFIVDIPEFDIPTILPNVDIVVENLLEYDEDKETAPAVAVEEIPVSIVVEEEPNLPAVVEEIPVPVVIEEVPKLPVVVEKAPAPVVETPVVIEEEPKLPVIVPNTESVAEEATPVVEETVQNIVKLEEPPVAEETPAKTVSKAWSVTKFAILLGAIGAFIIGKKKKEKNEKTKK